MPKTYDGFNSFPPSPEIVCDPKKEPGARQSEKESCDINVIVSQFNRTNLLPAVALGPMYEDVSSMPDYRSALDAVNAANALFMGLPAAVRKRFGNDPAEFLDFTSNPENRDEMVTMGLIAAEPAPPVSATTEPKAQ